MYEIMSYLDAVFICFAIIEMVSCCFTCEDMSAKCTQEEEIEKLKLSQSLPSCSAVEEEKQAVCWCQSWECVLPWAPMMILASPHHISITSFALPKHVSKLFGGQASIRRIQPKAERDKVLEWHRHIKDWNIDLYNYGKEIIRWYSVC